MVSISHARRSLFSKYASEFEKNYLLEPPGQKHQQMYKKEREEVTNYWKEIKNAKKKGKKVTNMVLEKLLPYSNTRHNREKGYRISVAPAITKDLIKWFENAGWQKPENWDNIANALFDLFYGLIEKGDWGCLTKFEENDAVSKGIKSGFITPTLYYLNPEYRMINNKTIDTINYLLRNNTISRDLSNYKHYLEVINDAIEKLHIQILKDSDVFDAFCHWMCDKRLGGYARSGKEPEPDEGEEGTPIFEDAIEPQNHWEAIFYIVKTGNLLGYKTYVAEIGRAHV